MTVNESIGADNAAMLRAADPERDGAACAAVYAPYVEGSFVSFEEEAPDAAEMARRIAAATADGYPWLVAERAGDVAGFAYGSRHRDRAGYRFAADVAVYVDARHHGAGVGRELYGELLRLLRVQGLRWACAGIALPNEASVGLHEALGFERVGVYREIGFKEGAWRDVGWWQLDLRAMRDD
jgi:phosphinothricin acetyltransferase